MSRDARDRQSILRDLKFYHPPKQLQYRVAQETLIRYVCNGATDESILQQEISQLKAEVPTGRGHAQRIDLCVQALMRTLEFKDKFQLNGMEAVRACDRQHRMRVAGVTISVYPEIVLRGIHRKQPIIGTLKFRFVKSQPLNEEAGVLCAALLKGLATSRIAEDEAKVNRGLCRMIDVFDECRIYEAPQAVTKRQHQVVSTCQEIAAIWPTIQRTATV